MTSEQRTQYLKYLNESSTSVLQALEAIPAELFTKKPSPDNWSAADVMEHLLKVESLIIDNLAKIGPDPINSAMVVTLSDEEVLKKASDIEERSQAREGSLPSGLFKKKEEAIEAFKERRSQSQKFIEETDANLASFSFPHPRMGLMSGGNWLVFVSGHSLKHVPQLESIYRELLEGK
ncbi:MAG: DinB family protein [Bacteroidia bacterium]|nr:DinB family protein [Bacteroidia bacterium]